MTNGWQEVPLKEVAKPVSRPIPVEAGTEYRTIGVKWWGMGAYERESIDGSRTAAKTLSIVREGDLIINKIWVRHGSVAIAGKDVDGCFGSGEFPTFELDLNRIDQRWMHWQTKMKSFWEKCDNLSRGTSGKNRIKPELFLTIDIPLPPLTEQRRIVARIESVSAHVNEAQHLREEAEFEAELLVGREIASLFANAKDWNSYNLGDLISEMSYGTSEKAHNERVGIPVLRMGNIQSGKLDLTGLKYMHPSEQEMKKLRLQKGDILVNRTNSAELVGKCAVFDLEGDYLFASYIIRIRLDQQKADPRLVAQYINSPAGRAYMFAERKQMTGQANVNSKKLAALPISLPSLDEQRRIVAYLDGLQAKVNALRELQSSTSEELSALMPSILDIAFKGEM
jgi:type I restriction enzyme S subunit